MGRAPYGEEGSRKYMIIGTPIEKIYVSKLHAYIVEIILHSAPVEVVIYEPISKAFSQFVCWVL